MATTKYRIKVWRLVLPAFQSVSGRPADRVHDKIRYLQCRFPGALRQKAMLDGDFLPGLLKFERSEELYDQRICSIGRFKH